MLRHPTRAAPRQPWERRGVARIALYTARSINVAGIGFGIFLASVPLGMAGLCDPKATRGNLLLAMATLAIPIGLLTAAG